MFDPTVFENLKVGFENQVYDLDNLTGQIRVTGRTDRLELSVMSREFAVQLELAARSGVQAEIRLEASLKDLAAEILEMPGEAPGCELCLRFLLQVQDPSEQCQRIEEVLQNIWQPERPPVQTISFEYGMEPAVYRIAAELRFARRINEDQMGDIPELVQHVLRTLSELAELTEK